MPDKAEDFTIAKVWNWRKGVQPKPDLILSYGSLVENQKITLPSIGNSFKWTVLLPNCDLVIGPEMLTESAAEQASKEQLALELKEFKSDMIFLKKAMTHGTIRLNEFPRK